MRRSSACWHFIVVAAALGGCSDISVVGGGGSGGGHAENPYDYSDLSPTCQRWCSALSVCGGEGAWTADKCKSDCEYNRYPGCEAESDDLLSCWAEYQAHDCVDWVQGCNAVGIVLNQCIFGQVECEEDADSCSCAGNVYGGDLEVSCQVVGYAPQGGAGEGGAAADLVVECQCKGASGEVFAVCEQSSLDCDPIESCCKLAG